MDCGTCAFLGDHVLSQGIRSPLPDFSLGSRCSMCEENLALGGVLAIALLV